MAVALLSMPAVGGCADLKTVRAQLSMKTKRTGKALVLWFSQTGYTKRNGRLLANRLEKLGLNVTASEMREFEVKLMEEYDLIVIGSPVFYYDTPDFVKSWIASLPHLNGTAVAAYVTFGGPEGNQDNAVCSILESLAKRGGVPIGAKAFMNMSAYPLSWSENKVGKKTWMARHLPNEETYSRVRQYAVHLVDQINKGNETVFTRRLTIREASTWLGLIYWTKVFVSNHSIVEENCLGCGTCVEKCPADAIDQAAFQVDTDACVMCFGCVNNCPAQAIHMEYGGRRVIGYKDFMRMKNLMIKEPEELGI